MGLELEDLIPNPIAQFQNWFEHARQHCGMTYPNAACLSTATADGWPDGRIVLLRSVNERGFTFYTNLQSTKGLALAENPRAAMTFYWDELQRQVRVQGSVSPVSAEDADTYFQSRPRNSQIGAWASEQSRPMKDREALESRFRAYESQFEGGPVKRPPHWSGFTIRPVRIEFWQERDFRLHDRFVYLPVADGWKIERLSP